MPPSRVGIPASQQAVIQNADGECIIVQDARVPKLRSGNILVKTMAVALNPTDFKMGSAFPVPGAIVGIDYVGEVILIDDQAARVRPDLRVGDFVCGGVHGNNPADLDSGCFAEYVTAPADLVLRAPADVPLAQAAALGTGLTTACMVLNSFGIDFDVALSASPTSGAEAPVLIYGASTASGTMAIQLLKLAGFDPIGICSPHNFDMVKSYGASAVFDYKNAEVAEDVKKHTKFEISHALACITNEASITCCEAAMGTSGGHLVLLEDFEEEWKTRDDVSVDFVLALEAFGNEVRLPGDYYRAANSEKHEMVVRGFAALQPLLDQGIIRSHPTEVVGYDFGCILEGMEQLGMGMVSGKKLTVVFEGRDLQKTQNERV
ncbi:zinc-binding dehydrogenase [Dactylonectria estremocensis]|uniref:Zinc-binding dehydrogenase n=1 Tax=Dactylonectria estremocensis TaxID=1079267 RepID=A0A9P9DGN8_9HYPO|nr:zinc-binding dehydrogenase [Dactylonectria estremocensis]